MTGFLGGLDLAAIDVRAAHDLLADADAEVRYREDKLAGAKQREAAALEVFEAAERGQISGAERALYWRSEAVTEAETLLRAAQHGHSRAAGRLDRLRIAQLRRTV